MSDDVSIKSVDTFQSFNTTVYPSQQNAKSFASSSSGSRHDDVVDQQDFCDAQTRKQPFETSAFRKVQKKPSEETPPAFAPHLIEEEDSDQLSEEEEKKQ